MNNPLEALLQRKGLTKADIKPKSKLGKILHRGGVPNTPEMQRILELPSYRWQDDPEIPDVAAFLEQEYAHPPREYCKRRCGHEERQEECPECIRAAAGCVCRGEGYMSLRPIQAAALQAIHDIGGMLGPIRVGGGKTMISYLAGSILGAERVLLVIPAKLKKKTEREFALLKKHWRAPKRMHIITYELLSRDRGLAELQAYRPDLVIADECFPPGTQIATPEGTKSIEDLRTGDRVWSVGRQGPQVEEITEAWSNPQQGRLIEIVLATVPRKKIRTTEEHPFYTSEGWKRAGELRVEDEIVCLVPEVESQDEEEPLLLSELLCSVEDDPTGHTGRCARPCSEGETKGRDPQSMGGWSLREHQDSNEESHAGEQPHALQCHESEGIKHLEGEGTRPESARGEREAAASRPQDAGGDTRLARRVDGRDRQRKRTPLQHRHSQPFNKSGSRGGREIPQGSVAEEDGLGERRIPSIPRMARIESIQRTGAAGPGEDRRVYSLEVSGPRTYVLADTGAVVHNSHKFKNPRAACTKRMHRHLTKENPTAGYVDMSGTVTKRSILEYHHRANWAIPDGLQALPRKYHEVRDWADAIDEKPSQAGRLMPGALLQMCNDEQIVEISKDHSKSTAIRVTREAYGRRLMSAPGVVGTEDQFDGAMSLQIQAVDFEVGPAVVEAFQGLRDEWILPDGRPVDMPAALWSHARSLVQGFYRKFDPAPPEDWMLARREWASMTREVLSRYHDIDSPLGVTRAVEDGRASWAAEALSEWRAIKDEFVPNSVAEWVDDSCLRWVADWASKNRGIIWVHEVPFGVRLSEQTGIPYYGQEGLCKGKMIEAETDTCIASIGANSEGRNLQYAFSKNLIVSAPPGGAVWEQMLGRTHRDGQEADEVTVDVVLACFEQWDVFRRAMRDAEYIERTTFQSQKLNFADIEIQDEVDIQKRHRGGDPLWSKRNAEFYEGEDEFTEQDARYSAMSPVDRAKSRMGGWRQGA